MSIVSSAEASPRSCDVDHLLQSLAGNRSAARKLVQMFLDVYPGKVVLFDAALQAEDWVALRRVVHELRGSCSMFSATACLALAGKLEDALPDHVDPELTGDCVRFKDALVDVAGVLHRFLDEPPDSPRECQGAQ